jgi:sugar/nucleoside kinase (ribokinase family)
MSLLVTGSIGIDDVKTPFGEVKGVYGGSAVYFSYAARLFEPVRFVGVVGEDFPDDFRKVLERDGIDLAGLEVRKGSRTFRWSGAYDQVTSDAKTLEVELNVLAEQGPKIPDRFRDTQYVFLAATHPDLQFDLVQQLTDPKIVVADTRDMWITQTRDELMRTLKKVHGVILNDVEARMLTEIHNLVLAARKIIEFGPTFVVIKKGENGAMLVTKDDVVALPAYPTTEVKDPTGAGDSFAGGMMGYIAAQNDLGMPTLRRALAYGMITASFTIEDFSLRRIQAVTRENVDERLVQYATMLNIR